MKSAYEKALERFGQLKIEKLTNEQKQQLTELEILYKSKLAERELMLENEKNKALEAGDFEKYQQVEAQLISERKRIKEELEIKKEEIRCNK